MKNPEQKHKHLKHFNTPGHAHELTFSCYHRLTYLSDPVACVRRNLATKPSEYPWSSAYAREKNVGLIPDRFNIPVAMLNPQIQRIGVM